MNVSRFVLSPVLILGLAWIACGVPESHVYFGDLYDRDADCLDPGKEIDPALAGPPEEAGTCEAICISDLDGAVWVSHQCPPYPTTFDVKSKDPACAEAFAAMCRHCPIEAGPVQIVCDAGAQDAPAESSGDAASEAAKGKKDGGGE